jgi:ABC-type transport system substrate-binding protein
MVRLISEGSSPVATGIVPPNMPGYENPNVSTYEFDPERALALIAESKYGDVSKLPKITLHVSGTGGEVGSLIESIADSYQKNLDLEIAVEQVPWAEFLADLSKPEMPYQMYQLGWIADYPGPQNFLEILFHSRSAQNHGHYSNPEVDALLEQAAGIQDEAERVALYQQAEQMILDDAAVVPLSYGVENWLVKPYVKNFWITPISVPKLQYIAIAEH